MSKDKKPKQSLEEQKLVAAKVIDEAGVRLKRAESELAAANMTAQPAQYGLNECRLEVAYASVAYFCAVGDFAKL